MQPTVAEYLRQKATVREGLQDIDARVILAVAGVLALSAVVASLGPARRASRVDPMVALRYD